MNSMRVNVNDTSHFIPIWDLDDNRQGATGIGVNGTTGDQGVSTTIIDLNRSDSSSWGESSLQLGNGLESSLTVGPLSLSSNIHGPVSEVVSFDLPDVGAVNESYCIRCIRDLLRSHLNPMLNPGPMPAPVSRPDPVIIRSRYDLLKESKDDL